MGQDNFSVWFIGERLIYSILCSSYEPIIESLSLSVDDLKYTKDNGYVKGITNIFVKNLKDLRPRERPIYCSNVEDMEFYIKDENKWKHDLQNRNLDKSIESVTQKQIQAIVDWRKNHPCWKCDLY